MTEAEDLARLDVIRRLVWRKEKQALSTEDEQIVRAKLRRRNAVKAGDSA